MSLIACCALFAYILNNKIVNKKYIGAKNKWIVTY